MRSCAALTLTSSHTATQLLPHSPSSKRQHKGREKIEKILWVKVKKRRPLSPYCHCHHFPITGQRRVDLGKINLTYCQLKKLWIVRNSNKNITDHSPTPLLFPKLQLLLHSQHLYPPQPQDKQGEGWGMGVTVSTEHLCCSFLTLFPCSSLHFLHGIPPYLQPRLCGVHVFLSYFSPLYSQNDGNVEIGRDLWRSSSRSPQLRQGQLEQLAQRLV